MQQPAPAESLVPELPGVRVFASWAFLLFAFALIRSTFLHQNDVPSMTDRHLDWQSLNFDFSERGRDELAVLLDSGLVAHPSPQLVPVFASPEAEIRFTQTEHSAAKPQPKTRPST